MDVPLWVNNYKGIRYLFRGRSREEGLDCWGLTRLIMLEQFDIELPSYDTDYESVRQAALMRDVSVREQESWTRIDAGQERAGDLILIRMQGQPIHVGVVIGGGRFVHIYSGIDVTHDRYRSQRWKDRICGFYRYAR